ncbi:MAG: hypothetical protein K0Q48_1945 [Bacillota bacterium]|nr:hypothetical protein [Bacillota bacterium]
MESITSIREELTGKTEMSPENENDLLIRLEEIERDGKVVDPLPKSDWIGIAITFFVLGLLPLLYYAIKLF